MSSGLTATFAAKVSIMFTLLNIQRNHFFHMTLFVEQSFGIINRTLMYYVPNSNVIAHIVDYYIISTLQASRKLHLKCRLLEVVCCK